MTSEVFSNQYESSPSSRPSSGWNHPFALDPIHGDPALVNPPSPISHHNGSGSEQGSPVRHSTSIDSSTSRIGVVKKIERIRRRRAPVKIAGPPDGHSSGEELAEEKKSAMKMATNQAARPSRVGSILLCLTIVYIICVCVCVIVVWG